MTAMKRIVPLLLAVCLLLCACGSGLGETTQATTAATTEAPAEATTEATTEAATEPTVETTETTEPVVLYRNPLNGSPLDEPWTGRATAIVINNIKAALPQYGISEADLIYEVETEGGITRLLAVYSDLSGIGTIGPVRSARTYFNNLALSHDAVLIHCGGSTFALRGQYSKSTDTISKWAHINEQSNSSCFFRDYTRYDSGYAWEHTLFTDGSRLTQALADKGYNTTYENGYDHGLTFADEISLNGSTAATVTVTFKGGKTTTMTYNSETGLYEVSQYDSKMIDANTGFTMTYRNVLVLYAEQTGAWDGTYTRSFYNLNTSGSGVFACDGVLVPINWSRDSLRGPITYTLEDGTPLTLGVGTTYVGIVSKTRTVSYS